MVSRPADVNAYDETGETIPPAAGSSHLCRLPSRTQPTPPRMRPGVVEWLAV